MATVIWATDRNGYTTSSNQLDDSWRSTALAILDAVPSTWNGHSVKIQINYTRNGGHAAKGMHPKGLAFDSNLIIGGVLVRTGNIGTAKKTDTFSVGGKTYLVFDLYSELLGNTATSNGCTWGGNFRTTPYDPMHVQAGSSFAPKGYKISNDGENIIEVGSTDKAVLPSDYIGSDMYSGDAGSSTKLDSESAIVSTANATSYIGYGFSLSDINVSTYGNVPLNTILSDAGIPVDAVVALNDFAGVKGSTIADKIKSHPELAISEDNATSLLANQINALLKYIEHSKGFKANEHPSEISTAIASYFIGKNMSDSGNISQLSDMIEILKSDTKKAITELARYIEIQSEGLPQDLKSRRLREVQLLRSYDPNSNTGYTSALTTTEYKGNYDSEEAKQSNLLNEQMDEIRKMLSSRKSSESDPASAEYDDTFNDIEQSTLDAVASLMQVQQTSTDLYFGNKELDYYYRMKTKNFYTVISRALNCKVTKIDVLMESESLLKNHKDYTLSQMYSMIPYSTGIAYTVKKNAISRCLYRIRLIEANIKAHESDLIGFGCPSTNAYADVGVFIATLPLRMSAVAVAELIYNIESVFGRLAILKEQLRLEKANLVKLKKDASRYS